MTRQDWEVVQRAGDKMMAEMQVRRRVRACVDVIGLRAVLEELRDLCRDRTKQVLDVYDCMVDDLDASIDAIPEGWKDAR